jgi:hypothetical protein
MAENQDNKINKLYDYLVINYLVENSVFPLIFGLVFVDVLLQMVAKVFNLNST